MQVLFNKIFNRKVSAVKLVREEKTSLQFSGSYKNSIYLQSGLCFNINFGYLSPNSKTLKPDEKLLVFKIEKLTKEKNSSIDPELEFHSKIHIRDNFGNLVVAYAFVTKDIDYSKPKEPLHISLFDNESDEIGYLKCYLNKIEPDYRETPKATGFFSEGKGQNPYVKAGKKYVYVSHVDNFFNSRKERTMFSCPNYTYKTFRESNKVYKGVARALYSILTEIIESKCPDNAGINLHAKISNGSKDAHVKMGFSEYDKNIYTFSSCDEEIHYQGLYIDKDYFSRIEK